MTEARDRALVLLERQHFETAEHQIRQILAAEPNDGPAHALLALCLIETGRLDDATAAAERAVALEPELAYCHYALAMVFTARAQYDAARAAADSAVRLQPTEPDYFALLARIHMAAERWGDALAAADRALALDPGHDGGANVRALALRRLGRGAEADAALDAALARDPRNPFAHATRGWSHLEGGRTQAALDAFGEALRLDPTMHWAREGILTTLKASTGTHGTLLRFVVGMRRLNDSARWGMLLAGLLLYRVLDDVARSRPALAPAATALLVVYLVLVLCTWAADPLLDLVLRLDRSGRQALSDDRATASGWVAATLLAAGVAVAAAAVTHRPGGMLAALAVAFLTIPVAGVFHTPPGRPRSQLALYAVAVGAVALAAVVTSAPTNGILAGLAVLGSVLGSYLVRALAR